MIHFRTDASPTAGYGRLIRSLNLALQLRGKNRILFVMHRDVAAAKILDSLDLPLLPVKKSDPGQSDDLRLLIHDTAEHSGEEAQLETYRRRQIPILQIKESLAEASFGDWVLDLTLPPPEAQKENSCSGPEWLPLHPRFRHFQKAPRKYKKQARIVILFLGGDPGYRRVRGVIDMLCRHSFRIKVAADFLLRKADRKGLKRIYPSLHFIGKVECLARPLFEADLTLVTPGAIALEAAACGTPAVYLYRNETQRQTADWLQQKGVGVNLGSLENVSEETLIHTLRNLETEKREKMGKAGKELVDARGLFRIMDLLKAKKIIS